ncbi:hypothetical protein [Meiothermus sp. Pnk-1]|uniref:hypothetical protein n=1 Tax=Meiothermus sp. Pnk-1 TaxID=873128 RepID=UPI000D7C95D1|nr:hypothetical protein [Meiothermus sp. Pnk-1]PZA08287.1 hypothetical protein DNA98_03890 [Meiothermus sp. Pnk-1]
MADHFSFTAFVPTAEPPPSIPAGGGERFLLPRWFKRDGINAHLLQILWDALQSTDPEGAVVTTDVERAVGRWLDVHAALYGIPARDYREDDAAFLRRILAELRIAKTTPVGIEQAIAQVFPGTTALVYDWTTAESRAGLTLRRWNGALHFDGSARFNPGGPYEYTPYYRGVLIVRLSGGPYQLERVKALVNRFRSAGVVPIYEISGQPSAVYLDGTRVINGSWTIGG